MFALADNSEPAGTVSSLLLLCRFSDAGMRRRSTRSGGRRPKSAKARNRGPEGARFGRCDLWGFGRGVGVGDAEV